MQLRKIQKYRNWSSFSARDYAFKCLISRLFPGNVPRVSVLRRSTHRDPCKNHKHGKPWTHYINIGRAGHSRKSDDHFMHPLSRISVHPHSEMHLSRRTFAPFRHLSLSAIGWLHISDANKQGLLIISRAKCIISDLLFSEISNVRRSLYVFTRN